ncbi:MAG: hypothetical protein K5694_06500, partial [Bacilli bacterium]|nr:hypothetical protein [Bacilli bacterium]
KDMNNYLDLDDLLENRYEIVRDMEGLKVLDENGLKELDKLIEDCERLIELDEELEDYRNR